MFLLNEEDNMAHHVRVYCHITLHQYIYWMIWYYNAMPIAKVTHFQYKYHLLKYFIWASCQDRKRSLECLGFYIIFWLGTWFPLLFSPIILQFICFVEDDIDLIVGAENCVLHNLDHYLRKHHYNFIIQSRFLLV